MEKLFGIGDVIRKLRLTKKNMGVIEFADFAGVNKATISNIENGGNFKIDVLERIAVALDMSVSELYAHVEMTGGRMAKTTSELSRRVPSKRRKRSGPKQEERKAG